MTTAIESMIGVTIAAGVMFSVWYFGYAGSIVRLIAACRRAWRLIDCIVDAAFRAGEEHAAAAHQRHTAAWPVEAE